MMKGIITGKEKKLTQEELIKEYQQKLSSNILAFIFVSNYYYISQISNKWNQLDSEDKASFCLQELDKALRNFNFSKNVKFSTYFLKCFDNRLYTQTRLLNTNNRKCNYKTEEFTEALNLYTKDAYFDNLDILETDKLSKIQKQQCKLLNAGYSIKEIAKYFGISTISIYKRNIKIKKILINLV